MSNTPLPFDLLPLSDLEDDDLYVGDSKLLAPTAFSNPTPAVIFEVITDLIERDDVQSVSCLFDDPEL